MTEPNWKVSIDRDGLTISSDLFTLTTGATDPMHLESVVSELQRAVRSTYGQYCGLSRAVEMVGERWGFLIVRDLMVGPKTAAELHSGLPRISAKLLSTRLAELEYSGIIQPVEPAIRSAEPCYELTPYGRAAEDAMLAFGRWGAASLAMPRPEDIVTDSSLIVALRATFLPDMAIGQNLGFELRIGGHILNVRIVDGVLHTAAGPMPDADAVLDLGFALRDLLAGVATAQEVLDNGQVSVVSGPPEMLDRFIAMFQLPRLPAPHVVA